MSHSSSPLSAPADILARLSAELDASILLTQPDDIAPYVRDWRGIYQGQAVAVLRPRNTEEVSHCVRLCHELRAPISPRGGNTGLCGGATPDQDPRNVVISLDRMNRIRNIDTLANVMVADAGCILGELQRAAEAEHRFLPLSLAAQDSCVIGGNVATNAGGINVVRYGMTRDLVLGLEVVLPDGEIWNGLNTLRKDNTGYDLKQLFIGAEGTLGIITGVVLKLLPQCTARGVALAAVDNPQHALELFSLLYRSCGQRIQAFEYFTHDCLELVQTHVPQMRSPFDAPYAGYVLIELGDTTDEAGLSALLEEALGEALEQELCVDVAISTSLAQTTQFWRMREEISEAQRADGPHLKHDISLPIGQIPDFMASAAKRVEATRPGTRLFVFGHFGDGNLHYNLSRPEGAATSWATDEGDALTEVVYEEVIKHGGSISAEHGIGQLKRHAFLEYKDPLALKLMRQIKQALDPHGIMNPGKVL